jgi:glycogen synthase
VGRCGQYGFGTFNYSIRVFSAATPPKRDPPLKHGAFTVYLAAQKPKMKLGSLQIPNLSKTGSWLRIIYLRLAGLGIILARLYSNQTKNWLMARASRTPPTQPKRIFYAAGPGDAIHAHKHWVEGIHDPTEVSITFSSQIEQFAKDIGAKLFIVCYHDRKDFLRDGPIIIEHLPKFWPGASGILFHFRELIYGLMLLMRALRFRADVAILDSGCTHYFWQSLFAIAGIKVVPVLHNSLWPNGYKPQDRSRRCVLWLDRFFWRHIPLASLCVSPVCSRQVEELAGPDCRPLVQVRAQFNRDFFDRIPPAPPHNQKPFQIMFIGRVTEAKGVLDIVEMARQVESRAPGRVRWIICGTGADLNEVHSRIQDHDLQSVIKANGWTSLEDLTAIYAQSHCSIVPTRSTFVEGLAMTAAEATLAGRPLISNPVVPALELLRSAAVAGRTNDTESYVEEILKLVDDPDWYQSMVAACPTVSAPFLDRHFGLTHVLKTLFAAK